MITGTLPYHDRKYTSIFYAWQEADVMMPCNRGMWRIFLPKKTLLL